MSLKLFPINVAIELIKNNSQSKLPPDLQQIAELCLKINIFFTSTDIVMTNLTFQVCNLQ